MRILKTEKRFNFNQNQLNLLIMKNLKLLSITFLTLFSCSDEIEPPLSNLSDNSKDFQQLIKEKYNGEILKFDDEKDFISFYEI